MALGRVVKSINEARELIAETAGLSARSLTATKLLIHISFTTMMTFKFFDTETGRRLHNGRIHRGRDPYLRRACGPGRRVIFMNTFIFEKGVMETVNEGLDMFYYSLREIPGDILDYGTRAVEAFGLKERFFHIEFFRTEKGLVALEVNARPPGGWSMDIFNYENDADLYDRYARLVTEGRTDEASGRPYYTAYVGLKDGRMCSVPIHVRNPWKPTETLWSTQRAHRIDFFRGYR